MTMAAGPLYAGRYRPLRRSGRPSGKRPIAKTKILPPTESGAIIAARSGPSRPPYTIGQGLGRNDMGILLGYDGTTPVQKGSGVPLTVNCTVVSRRVDIMGTYCRYPPLSPAGWSPSRLNSEATSSVVS